MKKTYLLSLIGPLAAILGGCPIYLDDGHGHSRGGTYCDGFGCYQCDDFGCWELPDQSCVQNADCPSGSYCDGQYCVVTGTCDEASPCPDGYMCDLAAGSCVPQEIGVTCEADGDCFSGCYCGDEGDCIETGACTADEDCKEFGESMVCDLERSTCRPDLGPCPDGQCGCVADGDCGEGLVCEAGLCLSEAETCRSDGECGQGRVCDGSFCAKSCGSDDLCPTGQACGDDHVCRDIEGGVGECVYASECGAEEQCINATCFTSCSSDAQCGSFEYCQNGACRPDSRPLS